MADYWSMTRGCGGGDDAGGGDDGDGGTTGNPTTSTTTPHNEDQAAVLSVDQVSVCTGTSSSQGSLLEASSYRQWAIPIVSSSLQQIQQQQQQQEQEQGQDSGESLVKKIQTDAVITAGATIITGANPSSPSALKKNPSPHRKRQRNISNSSSNNQSQPAFPIIPNPQITTSSESFGNALRNNSQYYHHQQQQQHANNNNNNTNINSCNTSAASSSKGYSQKQNFNTQELIPPSWIMSHHSKSNGNTTSRSSRYSRRRNGGRNRDQDDSSDCYHSHYRSLPIPPPLWWLQHDQPDTAHFTQLLSALVLTTALAVFAGYDAKQHCLEHETNAILELTSQANDDNTDANANNNNNAAAAAVQDDDISYTDDVAVAAAVQEAYEAAHHEAVLIEMDGCIKMFRHVLLPNLVVTFTLGCLGLYLLKQPQKTPRDAYTWTFRLVMIIMFIAIMQTYTVLSIMLMPRNPANVSDTENPYQSLGAVDLLGHVGDNANLYYLSWVSEALCLALVYQTATATVRARRAVRTQAAAAASQQSQSNNHNSNSNSTSMSRYPLLPATSWSNNVTTSGLAMSFVGSGGNGGAATTTTGGDAVAAGAGAGAVEFTVGPSGSVGLMKATTTMTGEAAASPSSFDSAQQDKEHHESRNTWYQSLYKLRIRTGIWTAALISCLVVTASAQYVWRQVLWPYVNFVDSSSFYNDYDNNNDDAAAAAEFGDGQEQQYTYDQASASAATAAESWDLGFAVCQSIAINSAKSGAAIPAQMCRRTLLAWLVGVLACLLSTFSIGMHLVARTYHHHCGDEVGHDAGAAVAAANSIHQLGQHHHVVDPRNRANNLSIVTIVEHYQHDELLQNDTYYLHYRTTLFRQLLERHRVPLGIELVLSILLSLLLGCNAVLATGVQGPAANVGNLYYASWFAFLLLIRICLGCLEEWYEVEKKDDSLGGGGGDSSNAPYNVNKKSSRLRGNSDEGAAAVATESGYKAAPDDGNLHHDQGVPLEKPSQESDQSVQSMMDPSEKDRVNRMRSYFFLGIFSAVCAASSYDAGANQEARLTRIQKFFILSPLIVACQSLILFILCLSKRCYLVASHFCVGGILSVVSFVFWLCDLILTMHSDESWAVNGIGEIEMANLYYFSWAGIITAGLQLMSYVQALFGISKGEDYMTVVWVAIVKVCFVILGAAVHIWHAIADKCDLNYVMSNGAFSFCSRTIVAMIIALTGMLVGGLVVLVRMMLGLCCPKCHCSRIQAHIEMLLSSFLVFLFGAAVALITSIGGPGQSVGDLYYSTWLAFWVSLGIFVSCYDQINREEDEQDKEKQEEEEEEYNPKGEYMREVDEPRPTAMGDSVLV